MKDRPKRTVFLFKKKINVLFNDIISDERKRTKD